MGEFCAHLDAVLVVLRVKILLDSNTVFTSRSYSASLFFASEKMLVETFSFFCIIHLKILI